MIGAERLRGAGDLMERMGDVVRDQDWDEMRRRVERFVDEKPVLAVGIAAFAGFLLARMLR